MPEMSPARVIRRSLKRLASRLGYRIQRGGDGIVVSSACLWGHEPWSDVQRVLGDSQVQTIFDIGANRGQTALELHALFGSADIYAFEPDPHTFAELQQATARLSGIHNYCFGFGAHNGSAVLHLGEQSEGNSFLVLSQNRDPALCRGWAAACGVTTAQLRRLDDFCHEAGIEMIDFLKIDVQGFEAAVIEGGGDFFRKSNIRTVFLEVNLQPIYQSQSEFHDLYKSLSDRGFTLVDLYNKRRSPDGRLLWCDALFQ
jgi:FkbM family methyltransferase